MREVVFGGIGNNYDVVSPDPCGGSVPSAQALVLTFLLNNYDDDDYQRTANQWEKEVGLVMQCNVLRRNIGTVTLDARSPQIASPTM